MGKKWGRRERDRTLTFPCSLPSEEKKGAGGGSSGPVRLRSTSRKDSISEDEMVLRERSYDYQFRYCGHCNTTTDIKEANFFGRSEALKRRRAQPSWQQEVGVGGAGHGDTMLSEKSHIPVLPLYPWANGFISVGLSFFTYKVKAALPTQGAITRTNEVIQKASSAAPGLFLTRTSCSLCPHVPDLGFFIWMLGALGKHPHRLSVLAIFFA